MVIKDRDAVIKNFISTYKGDRDAVIAFMHACFEEGYHEGYEAKMASDISAIVTNQFRSK